MHARSKTLSDRMAALALVPALVLSLAACGDDGERASPEPEPLSQFCTDARLINGAVYEIDPADELFRDGVEAMGALDPPTEIAAHWNEFVGSLDTVMSFDPETLDTEDPDQLAELRGAIEHLESEEFATAGAEVYEYLRRECGINAPPPPSS